MNSKPPRLYGLILSGGQSNRMGNDKGLLTYHGKPQREYLFELAEGFCDNVYFSARQDQLQSFPDHMPVITDQNTYRGPFNGILSAHSAHPNVAWLVLACDLPLLDKKGLYELVSHRNQDKVATAFSAKGSGLPEPLIAIWEPQALVAAKEYLKTVQSSCPRKFLINSDIQLVEPSQEDFLFNANSMEEYQLAKEKLG
ncbi:NTP transferase domain-containing protein [Muricauda sp. SCSIO 64092]|uniref:NTP transferase domain-containing protein n=1 Tax=Allomuricauda sp. SCSIO 64092 TaxID=2908842 RepID=UPI001FF27813|nr:NTP transferase domain-containing protein [Muricauda sp. SCSIO 64092]UOY06631.1 NTP transferase domain-containing protein [Muricauda sp. SCSIO 64092]